jgi:hypothetical protein
MREHEPVSNPGLADVLEAGAWARRMAEEIV